MRRNERDEAPTRGERTSMEERSDVSRADDGALSSLLSDLDTVVWEVDARSFTFRFVSGSAERVTGRSSTSWLAETAGLASHVYPDDLHDVMTALAAAGEGAPLDIEHRLVMPSGEPRWFRTQGRLVEAGPLRVLRGTWVDISERRAALDAQADAEARFRSVVERLPAIVYLESAEPPTVDDSGAMVFGDPGRLLYVSPRIVDILGYTPESWVADPTAWARQFHPDDVQRVREAYADVADGDEPFVADYRMFAADGRIVWIHDEAVLIRGDDGAPLFWQGIMTDVTARREEQDRVAEAEERYRALVEQLPAIVYTEDVTGDGLQVVYINARVRDVLGIAPEEWVADPSVWLRSVHPDDVDAVKAENERTERTGEPFEIEYRMIARDGRVVWFHDIATLVRRPDGDPAYWQGVMTDISARRVAEQRVVEAEGAADRLREADEIRTVFLRAVSHDLRGPLTSILGLAGTLERDDIDLSDDDARDLAGRIRANATRLERIVSNLLDLDRLERGVLAASRQRIDLGEVVRELVTSSDAVDGRHLELDLENVVVPADVVMVERIVDNLLRNAVRHTPDDRRIWMRVERAGDGATLVVEDDGPGIEATDRERIFEPFTRGGGAEGEGTGVGLAVVARFARLHGGRAWVEERPGGGASFRVYLSGVPEV